MAFKIPEGFKMPTAVVRVKDSDGDLFDVDLLQAEIDLNRQQAFVIAEQAFVIAETNRRRAQGRATAHTNILETNARRDCDIALDDLRFRVAFVRRDRKYLCELLGECKVPQAKWERFKPENVTAALAKKHELSKPAIRTILKNWKVRYQAF